MSNASIQVDTIIVDSESTVRSLLDEIAGLPIKPPSIYIDLEGIRLGRLGQISIMSLYMAPLRKAYLVDIHVLGATAFDAHNRNGTSLKAILESAAIPKVFFDVRNDSDAMFSHYQISVACIKDLQLMELASRTFSREYVADLAKCIDRDSGISVPVRMEWQRTKNSAARLFDPKQGGRYEVFNERPIKAEISQYCTRDVALLPVLWNVYSAKLRPPGQAFWRSMVGRATEERLKLSRSAKYDGLAKDKVRGPWYPEQIDQDIDDWNDDVLEMASTGMVLDEDNKWV